MLPYELKATLPHRTTFKPRAFSTAWALQAASHIDTQCPSLLNHILNASDCKRQVIFATLADLRLTATDKLSADLREIAPADCLTTLNPLAQIGRALIVSKPRHIIEAVFGSVPDGLLGVMKRIGSQPFACPLTYRLLHDLMSRREHRARAKALVQVAGLITEDAIRVVADLDGPWLSRAVICRVRSRQELDALTDAGELIRWVCPQVSDEALAASFENSRHVPLHPNGQAAGSAVLPLSWPFLRFRMIRSFGCSIAATLWSRSDAIFRTVCATRSSPVRSGGKHSCFTPPLQP